MDTGPLQSAQGRFDWSGLTFFLFSLLAIFLSLLIVKPFYPAITGAVVLAVATLSPYRWLAARLKSRNLTAAIGLLLVILSIVGPISFLVQSAIYHILAAVRVLQSGAAEKGFHQFFAQHTRISALFQYAIDNVDINQAVEKGATIAAQRLGAVLEGSVSALVQVVVMLFMLFFFYRDGQECVTFIRSHLPLRREEVDYLLLRIRRSVQALVLGRFIVAGVQGLVAGITYACLGVGGASLLGVATMLFAIVPAFGAFVIWLPVVLYLALIHHWIQAVILLGVGSLLISTLDNFLYPILVGTKLQMHTVATFLAMMGGIWLWGVSGLVLGPITFTLAESLLLIWRKRAAGESLSAEITALQN